MFEFGVGLDDGVGADDQILGKRANAGKLVAVAKEAGFGGVLNLLHELEVERLAEVGIEFLEEHTVSVYGYSVIEPVDDSREKTENTDIGDFCEGGRKTRKWRICR